uniref:Anaphase-promoting complex subunit 13 n=1 Tax=Syphacia muris TaxID=451379 RepID=A0A0N5B174_9BILA
MPLINMAEAVSRGDIIVDEVDALNKYVERFADGRDQPFRGGERLPTLPLPSVVNNTAGYSNNDSFSWNQVLVDEVDLARVAENGRGDISVPVSTGSHQAGVAGPAPNNSVTTEDGENNLWDRSLLVDEVDFLDAFEHGKIRNDGSNIMRLSYDNRIRRSEPNGNENGVQAETVDDDDVIVSYNNNDGSDDDDSDGRSGDVSNHPTVNA